MHNNKGNIKSGLLSITKRDRGILHSARNGKELEMKRREIQNVSLMLFDLILRLFPNFKGPYNKKHDFSCSPALQKHAHEHFVDIPIKLLNIVSKCSVNV